MKRCFCCFEEYEDGIICPHCGYVEGSAPKEPFHLFPGTELLNRYIIGETVGFGGFGISYKAWDKKLELIVAIKEYYPSGIVNRTPGTNEIVIYAKKREREYNFGKDRFLEEARNMAKFSTEPNIINVFEYFEENNTAYIVMEFLNGISLSSYMHMNDEKIDVETGLEIADNIGNALKKIHDKGIVHRDVSPDNIFICLGGGMKLIDFGAARFSNDENKLMTIILKPGFAPPEQYEKINDQGPWTDVYALGASLYYVLTGVKPEESTNRKIKDNLPYPHTIDPEIPVNISNAIMKAMALEVHLRYKSIDEFLSDFHSDKAVKSIEEEKKSKTKRRLIGICTATALLAAGIGISTISWEKEKSTETLPDCTISLWYCKSGDEALDNAEEKAYKEIIADFNSSFPNVNVELKGFDEEEYSAAIKSGKDVGVYEYMGEEVPDPLSLSDIYNSKNAELCSVLKYAEENYGNSDFLPVGFSAPAVFVNTTFEDAAKIKSSSDIDQDQIISSSEVVKKNLPNTKTNAAALMDFSLKKIPYYGAMTWDYIIISKALPVQYDILPVNNEKVYCEYTEVFCASNNDKSCNKAEKKLLEFMLNNNAQDALHIRNRSRSLPVNDAVLDVYSDVYNDFEGFFNNKNDYVFE